MPARIRLYVTSRGISQAAIDTHVIGWNGYRITIPIFNRAQQVAFFKLAKDPADTSDSPKMLATRGGSAELYGWERLLGKAPGTVICEGEYDRLVLESHGIAAVTGTVGASVFRHEWAQAFADIPFVWICFDRDEAGRRGAVRVAQMIPYARIVELPKAVGKGGDVTDYFVKLGKTREDFKLLCDIAQPAPPVRPRALRVARKPNPEVKELKARVRIEEVISRYVDLRPSGGRLIGHCPFHDDDTPSLVVYPETQSFRCYGCAVHGDILDFLMRIDKSSFKQAVERLRSIAA